VVFKEKLATSSKQDRLKSHVNYHNNQEIQQRGTTDIKTAKQND